MSRTTQRRAIAAIAVTAAVAGGILLRARLALEHVIYPYDAYYYLGGARSLATSFTYSFRNLPQTRYQPGYPIVAAPFTWVMETARAGTLVAILAWGGVGIVTYLIGRRTGGRATGVVAAVVVTFNPIATKWASVPMAEPVFTLCLALATLTLVAAFQDCRQWLIPVSGLFAGYSMITRFEGIVFFPMLVAVCFWMLSDEKWNRLRRLLIPAAVAVVISVLPILLWYLRNKGIDTRELAYSDELTNNFDVNFQSAKYRLDYYLWSGQKVQAASLVAYAGMVAGLIRMKREVVLTVIWFAGMVAGHLLWYYTYERFLMGALPALAIAAAWGLVAPLRILSQKPRLALSAIACVLVIAYVVFSVRAGVSFTREHIVGLNRDWGGETFVVVARQQRGLPGKSVSNRGAVFAFIAEQDTPYIFPVVADKDEVPHADPKARASYLKNLGVERVVLATRGRDPDVVLKEVRLSDAGLVLESTTTIDAPTEGTHQITAVYRIPD